MHLTEPVLDLGMVGPSFPHLFQMRSTNYFETSLCVVPVLQVVVLDHDLAVSCGYHPVTFLGHGVVQPCPLCRRCWGRGGQVHSFLACGLSATHWVATLSSC